MFKLKHRYYRQAVTNHHLILVIQPIINESDGVKIPVLFHLIKMRTEALKSIFFYATWLKQELKS